MNQEKDGLEIDGVTADCHDGNQTLSFRVGPIYHGNTITGQGLWIEYTNNGLYGPVLMNEEEWKELKAFIDEKFTLLGGKK